MMDYFIVSFLCAASERELDRKWKRHYLETTGQVPGGKHLGIEATSTSPYYWFMEDYFIRQGKRKYSLVPELVSHDRNILPAKSTCEHLADASELHLCQDFDCRTSPSNAELRRYCLQGTCYKRNHCEFSNGAPYKAHANGDLSTLVSGKDDSGRETWNTCAFDPERVVSAGHEDTEKLLKCIGVYFEVLTSGSTTFHQGFYSRASLPRGAAICKYLCFCDTCTNSAAKRLAGGPTCKGSYPSSFCPRRNLDFAVLNTSLHNSPESRTSLATKPSLSLDYDNKKLGVVSSREGSKVLMTLRPVGATCLQGTSRILVEPGLSFDFDLVKEFVFSLLPDQFRLESPMEIQTENDLVSVDGGCSRASPILEKVVDSCMLPMSLPSFISITRDCLIHGYELFWLRSHFPSC